MNKLLSLRKSNKLYVNILVSLTVSIFIIIVMLSTILYVSYERISLSIINSFIKDSLTQISYSAAVMTNSAKVLASQIYFDKDVYNILYSTDPDALEISDAFIRLKTYRTTSPFVHSIYIYNDIIGRFYSEWPAAKIQDRSSFFDKEILEILQNYNSYKYLAPIPRKIPEPLMQDNIFSNVYTFIYYDHPSNENKLNNAIIINISEGWMNEIISSLDVNPGSNTFIIDNQGKLVTKNKENIMLKDISNEEYVKRVLSLQESSGYFIENIKGVKSVVTFVTASSIGWKFIQITPYSLIVNKIKSMLLITIFIALLILFCGIFLSVVTSKNLYHPINNMIATIKTLEADKFTNTHVLKQEYLRKLLQDSAEYSLADIRKKFTELGIRLTPDIGLILILFRINHFSDFCNKYNISDRNLYKLAITNITSELCTSNIKNECIDMDVDSIILILNTDNINPPEFYQTLNNLIKEVQVSVEKHLGISLSAAVSSPCDSINNISNLYENTLNASRYRLFKGYNYIIYEESINEVKPEEYNYPIQKEHLLTDALMLEKIDDVKKLYLEIINSAINHSYDAVNLAILHLTLAISTATSTLNRNNDFSLPSNFNNFIIQLSKFETIEDINDEFFKIFENIVSKLEKRNITKYDDLVNKIFKTVQQDYANHNLSIDSIAESVNMSPVYLGRLFKKLTSKSIADYINEVRLEKARYLLATTDYSINEIAEKTGFIKNTYFYTYFKKMHGITPNEYRQNENKKS